MYEQSHTVYYILGDEIFVVRSWTPIEENSNSLVSNGRGEIIDIDYVYSISYMSDESMEQPKARP